MVTNLIRLKSNIFVTSNPVKQVLVTWGRGVLFTSRNTVGLIRLLYYINVEQ